MTFIVHAGSSPIVFSGNSSDFLLFSTEYDRKPSHNGKGKDGGVINSRIGLMAAVDVQYIGHHLHASNLTSFAIGLFQDERIHGSLVLLKTTPRTAA